MSSIRIPPIQRRRPRPDGSLGTTALPGRRSLRRALLVGLCGCLASVHSFVVVDTRLSTVASSSSLRRRRSDRRSVWLEQTTTALQEATISLQWADFYSPDDEGGAETPVLLLHGLLGSKRNFASLASSLGHQLDKPRRILGVDLRNHGDSDHASEMSYSSMARDVLEFMDHQKLDRVILVGHSMGGKVAQAMSLLHPHRVDGLVVLDIAPVTYTSTDPHWKAVEDIMHAMKAVENVSSKAELDKALRSSIPDPNLLAFVLTNYDARQKAWKIPVATICEQLESLAGFDIAQSSDDPCRYEGDVFIIHGSQSRFVRTAYMDEIAAFFPNYMLTSIRGAGHWVHAEAPDDTIALLKQYLDR